MKSDMYLQFAIDEIQCQCRLGWAHHWSREQESGRITCTSDRTTSTVKPLQNEHSACSPSRAVKAASAGRESTHRQHVLESFDLFFNCWAHRCNSEQDLGRITCTSDRTTSTAKPLEMNTLHVIQVARGESRFGSYASSRYRPHRPVECHPGSPGQLEIGLELVDITGRILKFSTVVGDLP